VVTGLVTAGRLRVIVAVVQQLLLFTLGVGGLSGVGGHRLVVAWHTRGVARNPEVETWAAWRSPRLFRVRFVDRFRAVVSK